MGGWLEYLAVLLIGFRKDKGKELLVAGSCP
jgi:hypothetical protein